ncbi:hypothetical protein NQ318_007697 [Aromia moschata]|uniref:UDENN domain-containing protein n=1 Tax=Aromia moschata TaxID=1265417 RepID=A0AAV8XPV7_9CUCU|nr:hypothetical protein NQ318_007697 [Aromia moschata]
MVKTTRPIQQVASDNCFNEKSNKLTKKTRTKETGTRSVSRDQICPTPGGAVNSNVLESRDEQRSAVHIKQSTQLFTAPLEADIFEPVALYSEKPQFGLLSSSTDKLSSCVDCLESILYPFTWHHTFIPILPEALWEFVESPTPLICGVLSPEVIVHHSIENGIVVNLDMKTVLVEEGDENKILSCSMQKVWKRSIVLANKVASSMDYVQSVYLSDAYLQKEEFIKSGKTKGIRRFLKMFTETYMFLAFLDTVLYNPENLTAFDKKIEMYGSEGSNVILDKLLEWNSHLLFVYLLIMVIIYNKSIITYLSNTTVVTYATEVLQILQQMFQVLQYHCYYDSNPDL